MRNRCFPSTPEMRRPRRRIPFWGHQKRRVFLCLGCDGSDGQACHVPGGSWPSKSSQKCPTGLPFAVPFGVLVRRSRFLCFLCRFLEGPTLDPLAQAQSKRRFSLFGVASKRVLFLQQLLAHFWYSWRRDPLKRHFKIEFENRSYKSVLVLLPGSIFASFRTPYGASFVPLGR